MYIKNILLSVAMVTHIHWSPCIYSGSNVQCGLVKFTISPEIRDWFH